MSVPVVIAFAGVLVAGAVTGMLAAQCVRQPRIGFAVWAAAMLGLTIALAAQSMGFARGFSPATFRVVQLFALALAPLWLAWGLAELVVANETARFGTRLAAGALTVVVGVILATDPLAPVPFGKSWPLAGPHFQPVSHYALDAAQAAAAVAVTAAVVAAVVAAGGRAGNDRRGRAALIAAAAVGLATAMTAAMRLPLPSRVAYPLLGLAAAALVWFGASELGELSPGGSPRRRAGGRADDNRPYRGPGPAGTPAGHPATVMRPVQRRPDAATATRPVQRPPTAAPVARPYGRILIFTLLDDRAGDFDRLAEQTAEEVRTREPDTLVYVIHLVPDAPMQRIFYEIYRDQAAFDFHESQPHMQRFVAERGPCVLATNVIELRLKYAKVAPLPGPSAAVPAGPAAEPLRTGGGAEPLRAGGAAEPLPAVPAAEWLRRHGGT